MKKIALSFSIALLTCFLSLGQNTDYSYYSKSGENWLNNVLSTSPSGAKVKSIDFPNFGYSITGSFTNKILEEGQIVSIYDIKGQPELMLKGKVSYIANRLQVTGIKYDKTEKGMVETYGTFGVSNSSDNLMVYKIKKAGDLSITVIEPFYYSGYYLDCPVFVNNYDKPSIVVDGKTGGRGFDFLYVPLKKSEIASMGYNSIINLLLTANEDAVMSWDRPEIKGIFCGSVSPVLQENGAINFRHLYGERTNYQGHEKAIISKEGAGAKMILNNEPTNALLSKQTLHIADASIIPIEEFWNTTYYFENLSSIDWEYRNGNTYSGEAKIAITRNEDNGQESVATTITEGKYTYPNGDYFEGDMSGQYSCGIPINGTMHFHDGTVKDGNWIISGLTAEQYDELSHQKFPSDIKAKAEEFKLENDYNRYMSAAKKAEYGSKYAQAKQYYESARALKPDAEKWDDMIKELDRKIHHEEFRRKLMAKYGSVIGNKLAEGNLEIGMTREMVVDAWSDDDLLIHSYRVSNTTDWNDNHIETWEYDYSMAKKYMDKELGEYAGLANALFSMGAAVGYNVRSELSKGVKFKYLKFKNGKLTELKDSSIYDDVDSATDDLSTALWLLGGLL